MRKVKKDLTELKEEEQVVGWDVLVYFNPSLTSPYGGTSREYETVEVDTWKEASDIAKSVVIGAHPKLKEEKAGALFKDGTNISHVKIVPRTRTVYVEEFERRLT